MSGPFPEGALFTGAVAAGFLGSAHCLGMCGGLVAAFSLWGGRRVGWPFHLLYHAGRVTTYVALGALVGWVGLAVAYTGGFRDVGRWVMIAADLFVILVGLGSAGALRRLNVLRLEFAGPTALLARWARRLQRFPAGAAAYPLGLAMGLLPCGFLYAVLLNAALTADPVHGAQVMLGFGLGTAPSLLGFAGATRVLSARVRGWMLRGAGLAVAALGLFNLHRHLVEAGCCPW